jgi:hypothetical protein
MQSYPGLRPAPSPYDRVDALALSDSGVVTLQIERGGRTEFRMTPVAEDHRGYCWQNWL